MVILAMQRISHFQDWRAKKMIEEGYRLLNPKNLWFLNFVPRQCNAFAHHLAQWAFHSNFSGKVDPQQVTGLELLAGQ